MAAIIFSYVRKPHELAEMTCKGHRAATKFRTDFVSQGILRVKLKPTDQKIIDYALFHNGYDTTLSRSDVLARLGNRQRRESSRIKTFSGTEKISSVSSAVQALTIDE